MVNILAIMNKYSVNKLPSDILLETSRNHKILRKQLKLSQTLLAEKAGVSLGSIKRFERTGQISFESLLKLSHILGRLSEFEKIFQQREDLSLIEKVFSDKTRGK